jgi:hypothetical protein
MRKGALISCSSNPAHNPGEKGENLTENFAFLLLHLSCLKLPLARDWLGMGRGGSAAVCLMSSSGV